MNSFTVLVTLIGVSSVDKYQTSRCHFYNVQELANFLPLIEKKQNFKT